MSWLCASFPRSKCFTDGKKQFSVVKILNSSGEMKNRASWRNASFFFIFFFFFFLPQPHFDCKNIHPPTDFIAREMPFLGSNPCLRYHCKSIRKEGSYFHIDFTHLLWFSAGWILSNCCKNWVLYKPSLYWHSSSSGGSYGIFSSGKGLICPLILCFLSIHRVR